MDVAIENGFKRGALVESKNSGEKYVKGTVKGYNGGSPANPQVVVEDGKGDLYHRGIKSLKIVPNQQPLENVVQAAGDILRNSVNDSRILIFPNATCILPNITSVTNTESPASGSDDNDTDNDAGFLSQSQNSIESPNSSQVDTSFYSCGEEDLCSTLTEVFKRFNIKEGTLVQCTANGVNIFNPAESLTTPPVVSAPVTPTPEVNLTLNHDLSKNSLCVSNFSPLVTPQ